MKGAEAIGKVDRRALDREGHQARRVRPQRLPLSRPHSRRRGRGPQSRPGVLSTCKHANESIRRSSTSRTRRLDQPRDQGRQGRQEPELQRAGRRRRRPRRGRLRRRQGEGSAVGDQEGHRGGEEEPDSRAAARHDDSAPDRRQLRRRQRAAEAGAGRHRHHRRRRGARGGRGGRDHQHPDEVARIGQPAQRRAGDDRRARFAARIPRSIARMRGKELERARPSSAREARDDSDGQPANRFEGRHRQGDAAQEPDRVQPQPGRGRAEPRAAADPPHRGAEGHAGRRAA